MFGFTVLFYAYFNFIFIKLYGVGLTMLPRLSSTSNNLCDSSFNNQEEKDRLLNEYMSLRNAIILRYRSVRYY
jgi:hypothetical protein